MPLGRYVGLDVVPYPLACEVSACTLVDVVGGSVVFAFYREVDCRVPVDNACLCREGDLHLGKLRGHFFKVCFHGCSPLGLCS